MRKIVRKIAAFQKKPYICGCIKGKYHELVENCAHIHALRSFRFEFFPKFGKNSVADNDKSSSIELTINSEKVSIPFTSLNTKINVFSIIGSKVLSVNIKSGAPEDSITLPKGYYILKVDNITRKIVVK